MQLWKINIGHRWENNEIVRIISTKFSKNRRIVDRQPTIVPIYSSLKLGFWYSNPKFVNPIFSRESIDSLQYRATFQAFKDVQREREGENFEEIYEISTWTVIELDKNRFGYSFHWSIVDSISIIPILGPRIGIFRNEKAKRKSRFALTSREVESRNPRNWGRLTRSLK